MSPPPELTLPLLDGAKNFRAVKPYRAADGRHLRAGSIFRSGELSRLNAADLHVVAGLNIRLVCDLRSSAERLKFPTSWPPGGEAPSWLDLPNRDDSEAGPAALFKQMLLNADATDAVHAMAQMYRRKPGAFIDSLRMIFDAVLQGDALPLLIHCHAGKDRTGFVTAMMLTALGIGRADIIEDYVATARFIPVLAESQVIAEWAKRAFNHDVDPAHAAPLADARADYIEAALDQVDTEWGGTDRYLHEAVGLTAEARAELQDLLLV